MDRKLNQQQIMIIFGVIFFFFGTLFYFKKFDFNAIFYFIFQTNKFNFNPLDLYLFTGYFFAFGIGFICEIFNKKFYNINKNFISPYRSREYTQRAWEIFTTMDKLIHDRINYFLVAESMLLFSCVTCFIEQSKFPLIELAQVIAFTGCIITIAWYYNLRRIRIRINNMLFILEKDSVWREYQKNGKKSISEQFILTSFLPSSMLFLWVFILFFSLNFNTISIISDLIPILLIIFIFIRTYWEYRFQKREK